MVSHYAFISPNLTQSGKSYPDQCSLSYRPWAILVRPAGFGPKIFAPHTRRFCWPFPRRLSGLALIRDWPYWQRFWANLSGSAVPSPCSVLLHPAFKKFYLTIFVVQCRTLFKVWKTSYFRKIHCNPRIGGGLAKKPCVSTLWKLNSLLWVCFNLNVLCPWT